ncbi:MAG TPA: hypothetical protein VFT12_08645, partial [Thermoanaerobaculia bacterium]|nr:hypothetical protein [Thermoanaerobaculia bacterium]
EIAAVTAVTIVVALTRIFAIARGPWDWDEMLFLLGMRDYDVALHHPHPPGFPLFIAAARLFTVMGMEPFRALQSVNLIAAVAIVPAMVFLCRELRLRVSTALTAAMLFAFFPNVWFFGGTAFSDVAAIVLAIVACALLLRGVRSPHAFIAGAIVLGIAAGFRPQNLLVGLVPAIYAAWSHIRQQRIAAVVTAAAVITGIVAASYGGAIVATGEWGRYRDALVAHQRYLSDVDSFLSATRPSLLQVSDDFFVRPFRFSPVNVALSFFALVALTAGLIKRRFSVLMALALFGPFWVLAWLTLDFHSAGRFSIGYLPLLAILAADGIDVVARHRPAVAAAIAGVLIGALLVWSWPGIARNRRELSPPMRAIAFVNDHVGRDTTIYVQKRLRPYSEYYLEGFRLIQLEDEGPRPPAGENAVYLREGKATSAGAATFEWPRDPLWNIVRRRYFEASVVPLPAK